MLKSMEDLIIESLEGKYFQHKKFPSRILHIQKDKIPFIEKTKYLEKGFSFFAPLENRTYSVSLNQLKDYIEISEEDFNQIKTFYNIKRSNKANLSAQKSKVINISTYKTENQKRLEERFYSLSDHLFPKETKENSDDSKQSC